MTSNAFFSWLVIFVYFDITLCCVSIISIPFLLVTKCFASNVVLLYTCFTIFSCHCHVVSGSSQISESKQCFTFQFETALVGYYCSDIAKTLH